jgi:hypothetical protein
MWHMSIRSVLLHIRPCEENKPSDGDKGLTARTAGTEIVSIFGGTYKALAPYR